MRKYLPFTDLDQIDLDVHGIAVKENHFQKHLIVSYTGEGRLGNIIVYVVRGCLRYVSDGREVLFAEPNDIILLPAYSCYDVYCAGEGSNRIFTGLYLRFSLSQDNEHEIVPGRLPQRLFRDGAKRFLPVFTRLHNMSLRGICGRLEIKAEVLHCLSSLVASGRQGVDIAISLINDNLMAKPSVAELAAKCLMSESTFRRRFAEKTGVTPLEYRSQQRLLKVDELLASGLYSLKGACEIAGFVDTSHYYKTRTIHAKTS